MSVKYVVLFLLGFILLGCTQAPSVESGEQGALQRVSETMVQQPLDSVPPNASGSQNVPEQGSSAIGSQFTGEVLAGSASQLFVFNKGDYEYALNSHKLIVLYFYANWCPICVEELPHLYSAFNELRTAEVVGFRVNFNDGDTDDDERQLASEYGVPYQHTKVFVKNRERILKSPEQWDKARYLQEINNSLSGSSG